MGRRGQGWHLGNESNRLTVQVLGVFNVFGVFVISRECANCRDHHAHGVSVVVETFQETLANVFMDEGMEGNFRFPNLGLLGGWEFAMN